MGMKKFKVKAHVRVKPRQRITKIVSAESEAAVRRWVKNNRKDLVIDSIVRA